MLKSKFSTTKIFSFKHQTQDLFQIPFISNIIHKTFYKLLTFIFRVWDALPWKRSLCFRLVLVRLAAPIKIVNLRCPLEIFVNIYRDLFRVSGSQSFLSMSWVLCPIWGLLCKTYQNKHVIFGAIKAYLHGSMISHEACWFIEKKKQ